MAKKSIKTAEQINALTDRVRKSGLKPRTELSYIQESFARIIIPTGLKESGKVMTYEESNAFISKIYGERAIFATRKEYDELIEELNNALKGYLSYEGYLRKNRERIKSILDDASNYTGRDFPDISNISTKQLNEFINEAARLAKNDKDGSASFYEHLMDLLEDENS